MKIQISRSKYVEESRAIADLRLTEKAFLPGELVMLNYYKDPDFRNDIGVLIAIGVKEGIGEDCYRILSAGGTVKVRNVVNELPDVSKLVHNELYVYHDSEGVWNYVYKINEDPERRIEPITGGPYIFIDLESGYRWFYENQECKREDDFFSSKKITEILAAIGDTKIKPTIVSDNGYIFKSGDIKDLILNVGAVDEATGIDLSKDCKYFVNEKELIPDENGKVIIPNLIKDEDIRVVVKYPISPGIYVSASEIISIKFGYKFFYGSVDEGWQISQKNIESLEHNIINYRRDWAWDNINFTYKKIVIAYPRKYGFLSHIYDDNGLDYIRTYQPYFTKVFIDDEEYLVYIKKDSVSVSLFLQKYVFNESDSININENNLFDLINAWKNRNIHSGLVVLDENGKIDSSLVDNSNSGVFIPIKEIVKDYPTSGMEVGDVYYNEITGKLFIAIDSNSGVIDEPIQETLYIYQNEYYSWTGEKLRRFSRMESREIKTIKEIYGRD